MNPHGSSQDQQKNIPNKEWHSITDAASAAKASGTSVAYMERVAKALENKSLQKNAANFVGGRTDFMGGSEKQDLIKVMLEERKTCQTTSLVGLLDQVLLLMEKVILLLLVYLI